MRTFTVEQRRARLAKRHHLDRGADPPESVDAVTRNLVAVHATDPATPYLSLWARLLGFTVPHLNAALYDDHGLVKHLAMRRTLWMVSSRDLPAIQSVASDRVAANEARRLAADAERAGVASDGHAWLETADGAVRRHLRGAGPCSARELRETLPELAGTYDPARDWLARAEAVDPDDARAALVRRWLSAFGPATVTDIKWWFGATLSWARKALSDIDAVEVQLDGSSGFVLPGDDDEPEAKPWCALLPALDVTAMGWFDRDWYVGPHRSAVFDRNGNAGPTAWVDGRVVGAWRQDGEGRVELVLLEKVGRAAADELARRADELTAWLGGVRVSPGFPSAAIRP